MADNRGINMDRVVKGRTPKDQRPAVKRPRYRSSDTEEETKGRVKMAFCSRQKASKPIL